MKKKKKKKKKTERKSVCPFEATVDSRSLTVEEILQEGNLNFGKP